MSVAVVMAKVSGHLDASRCQYNEHERMLIAPAGSASVWTTTLDIEAYVLVQFRGLVVTNAEGSPVLYRYVATQQPTAT